MKSHPQSFSKIRTKILNRSLLRLACAAPLLALIAGCSSLEMLEENYVPEKGGVIQFPNTATGRKDMLAAAEKFCRGPIKILLEGNHFTPAILPSRGDLHVNKKPGAREVEAAIKKARSSTSAPESLIDTPAEASTITGPLEGNPLYIKYRCALQGHKG